MLKNFPRYLFLLIPLSLTLSLAACSSEKKAAENPTPALTPVTIQMNWLIDISSSPYYMAIIKGHFAKEGINVTLVPGGFENGKLINAVDRLVAGQAQFASANLPQVLQANANGTPVVAFMSLNQRSPLTLITNSESGIKRPQDLAGKTIAINSEVQHQLIASLLVSQGVDLDSVTFTLRTDFSVNPLIEGKADAMTGWIIEEGSVYEKAGFTPLYIMPADYGINTYDLLVVTTPQIIKEQPELVQKVARALIGGLQEVVADPDAAGEAALQYNNKLDAEVQKNLVQLFLPLINPAEGKLGALDPEVFAFNYQLLLEHDLITPFDIEKAYNLDFISALAK